MLLLQALAVIGMLGGCDQMEAATTLQWEDAESNAQFKAAIRERGSRLVCDLEVTRDGRFNRLLLAEYVDVHQFTLLKYNDWLLVLSGPYVLGGYNYSKDAIVPMNSDALPFTQHTLSGYPVATLQIDDGEDQPPFNFKSRHDR